MSGVIVIIIIFIIIGAFSGTSSKKSTYADHSFNELRKKKYQARHIDNSKNLFDRNSDIIDEFKNKILSEPPTHHWSHRSYYIDNITRDCLNEICLAENYKVAYPGSRYLSDWKPTAPALWQTLADKIKQTFTERQEKLKTDEEWLRRKTQDEAKKLDLLSSDIDSAVSTLKFRKSHRRDPLSYQQLKKVLENGNLKVSDIQEILSPNTTTWSVREKDLIEYDNKLEELPAFNYTGKLELSSSYRGSTLLQRIDLLNTDIADYNNQIILDRKSHLENRLFFSSILDGYKKKDKDAVIKRVEYIINNIDLPKTIPKKWSVDFSSDESILVVEVKLPDVVHNNVMKLVELKTKSELKPLSQKEIRDIVPQIHPAIMLRLAYEIFRDDVEDAIKLLVLNGWVEFDDPHTGNKTKAYTSSLTVEKKQVIELNLKKLEPLTAFLSLKGKSAGKLVEIIPIVPALSLNRKDSRFIDAKEVLNNLGKETNLAAMEWQDFEYLIRELFEKVFAKPGVEVKVTQASRDRGVDAVVFDPDPIKGGKFIIQAKRYTNTVDVSAVRDLCAVVKKEGASRGILVTTSTYGADAYAFANNEPITLLNGSELMGLLKQYGYSFRINLEEAKRLNIKETKK